MAFKRDGDDFGWLNRIRKRRIDELLSVDIPEDEALLMKNGRFCCVVCRNRPIFDTVHMLAIHRGGKNHLKELEQAHQEKLDLELLKLKREQETYLATGSVASKAVHQTSSGNLRLSAATPYDPRVKKKKTGHERKQRINLGEEKDSDNNSGTAQTTSYCSSQPTAVAPYIPKPPAQRPGAANNEINKSKRIYQATESRLQNNPQTISEYLKINKSDSRTMALKPYAQKQGTLESRIYQRTGNIASSSDYSTVKPQQPSSTHTPTSLNLQNIKEKSSLNLQNIKEKSSKKKNGKSEHPPVDEEKLKSAEKYLQARGAGWKKDLSGNWIQEEGVEFDSDEEPPDLP